MQRLFISLALLLGLLGSASAGGRANNAPYVQSLSGWGVYYARCIPAEAEGIKGTTTIYAVGKENDEKIDSYNWYSPNGVVLAWSPSAGKIAVVSMREGLASTDEGIELSFYLGGQLLRSYTAKELKALGVETLFTSNGRRMDARVVEVEQRPAGTNDYAFVVEINNEFPDKHQGRKLYFDIVTGELRK
ncbi:hypothetical protein EON80_21910 [bacterium]|nr:MAG: hypothetical protein EON80_21910 [bacterium]